MSTDIEPCGAGYETLDLFDTIEAKAAQLVSRTSFPIDNNSRFVPKAEANAVRPGKQIRWYLNGPAGTKFKTTLIYQLSGGHAHGVGTVSKFAVGEITPVEGTLQGPPPQNQVQIYTAGPTCCQILDRTTIGDTTKEFLVTVALGPFEHLSATTGISLVGATAMHPSNHWGTARLCNALRTLGVAFFTKFGRPIYVNDMSLQSGGRFDVAGQFVSPHQSHMDGRHADINRTSMSNEEQQWFSSRAKELGFLLEEHGDPAHWHVQFD
ncbi:MAG TPA: hypothetical protein VJQ52_06595 [Steroidobacteraceae bacterium]|nr:hypothetical protein [Steroidobacteraceae bacterium]